jgi:hypothetical protein
MQDIASNIIPPKELKQIHTLPILSGIFFACILLSSIGIFFYGKYQDAKIDELKQTLTQTQKEINELSQDETIKISSILSDTNIRPSLDVAKMVDVFRETALKSRVRFQGFSIKNDIISTTLIATEADGAIHPDPISTIIKMMKSSLKNNNMDITLSPITAVS